MRNKHPLHSAAVIVALAASGLWSVPAAAQPLNAVTAQSASARPSAAFDGVVEAVRQTVIAAQVSGAVVRLDVKAGDRVQAGQVLLRIDARAAEQNGGGRRRAGAGGARRAGRGDQGVRAPEAAVRAELHQPGGARARRGAVQGDAGAGRRAAGAGRRGAHADAASTSCGRRTPAWSPRCRWRSATWRMPGRALLDAVRPGGAARHARRCRRPRRRDWTPAPAAARRTARPARGAAAGSMPTRVQLLPTVDPATHTVQLRVDLPAGLAGVAPGMFARLWLPLPARPATPRCAVPAQAVVRRAEMTGALRARRRRPAAAAPGAPGPQPTATRSRCCRA